MGPRPCGRGWASRKPKARRAGPASMGPRPCGRGWMTRGRSGPAPAASFNGATALRPWMAAFREAYWVKGGELQWGHGLAAVDGGCAQVQRNQSHGLQWGHGLAAVDGYMALFIHPTVRGFNGATALRPWMATRRGRWPIGERASMGPRPCGRGWRRGERPCSRRRCGFNGATALRPWMAPRSF